MTPMQQALTLALKGQGTVEPNPMVGAVVVDTFGQIVGEGYHQKYGGPHAEVHALQQAGQRAKGGTLYVTLEPCCHFGKTPPCTNAIIQAGIAKVIVAMRDPFPAVDGGGIAQLQSAGITVEVDEEDSAARELNAPYLHLTHTKMPWVHAKWAMSLDGKIATRSGRSQWISGEESRRKVHELRGRMDAIMVGAGTVRADDPLLTARPTGARVATRVVVTNTGNLPEECQLLKTIGDAPVLVFAKEPQNVLHWQTRGAEVQPFSTLKNILLNLGQRRFTNVLVEGGGQLLGSLADAKFIHEIHAFIASILIGGQRAPSPIAGLGIEELEGNPQLKTKSLQSLGKDIYWNCIYPN